MKILITGGAGFLGSHICRHFVKAGHDVTCLDRLTNGGSEKITDLTDLIGQPNFRIDQRDTTLSPYKATPEGYDQYDSSDSPWFHGPLDAIVHLASNPSPKDHLANPIQTLLADAKGTEEMLQLARMKKAIFLLASTAHIDQPEGPTLERSVYKEGKRFAEALSAAYARVHDLEVRVIRMFNSYGPGMRLDDGRVVPAFIVAALKNEPINLKGGGQQISLCYVDDMVDAIRRILFSRETLPIEVGYPDRISVYALAQKIVKATGSRSQITIGPEYVLSERAPDMHMINKLGWLAAVNLDEGIARTIEDFRRRMV